MYIKVPENKFALYSKLVSLTGITLHELYKLRWTDISSNFSTATVHSTDGTHRTIELCPEAISVLRKIRNRFGDSNAVLPPHALTSYDDTSEVILY